VILSVELSDDYDFGVSFEVLRQFPHLRFGWGTPESSLDKFKYKGGLDVAFLDDSLGAFVKALETVGDFIADDISAAFGDLISSNQMTVRGNELWVEIELNSSLLFASADAMPSDQAFTIIDKVAAILKPFENPIHVEGFTDNIPISTAQYPTNWELSSARAASIVRMLAMQGVNPGRLASVGYGEFQPVANNATVEGRARNRRVVLVVSRNLDVRRSLTGTGTANATPDAALRRAGTQTAPPAVKPPVGQSAVNSPSPAQ
jgi:chemotaxis protein MotB